MSQKETLSRRKKTTLLRILECFSPFKPIWKVEEIVQKTGLSRKVVWHTLNKTMEKISIQIPEAKTAIKQPKKGVYQAVYPEFNELLFKLGAEEKKYTVEELLELFKEREELEFQSGKNVLWLRFIFPFDEDWQKEQEVLSTIKRRVYEASLKRNPDMLFRARQIFGYLVYEETEEEAKAKFLRKLEPLTEAKEGKAGSSLS